MNLMRALEASGVSLGSGEDGRDAEGEEAESMLPSVTRALLSLSSSAQQGAGAARRPPSGAAAATRPPLPPPAAAPPPPLQSTASSTSTSLRRSTFLRYTERDAVASSVVAAAAAGAAAGSSSQAQADATPRPTLLAPHGGGAALDSSLGLIVLSREGVQELPPITISGK